MFAPQKKIMQRITIAKGDGIGPEIMDVTLSILKAAGAKLEFDEIEIGEQVYLSGNTSGISQEAWDVIRKNKVLLKAPITTPQGGSYKSLNVTMRKTLGLFANVRPCMSYAPFVETKHPQMDVVIIRENEEDLYTGIEHQQTNEVVQCLKLITRPGCEMIVRFAFEYARANNRKKVSCFTKDNIMKQTDGLFHQVFKEVAAEYSDIKSDSWIIDIGAAKLANQPELFDVVVTSNLYGDIISDITAEISGSVGLAGTSNIGRSCTMFEAIHGSAPDIAGKNLANPTGLIKASVMLLNYIGQPQIAEKIDNAWACVIEEGIHTSDIYEPQKSKHLVGTKEFGLAIIDRLGNMPKHIKPAKFDEAKPMVMPEYLRKLKAEKSLKGVDLFVDWQGENANVLAEKLINMSNELQLKLITNRGVKVWPEGFDETFCTDHWRCRFESSNGQNIHKQSILLLLSKAIEAEIDIIKTENLYDFDGKRGYSLGQGQ